MKRISMGFSILISIFFLVGFGLMWSGLRSLYRGHRALKWPTTEGQILDCLLQEDWGSESTTWQVCVKYRYVVDNREFEGNRVGFGYAGSSTYEAHRGIYDKLRQASRVMVRYEPGNPDNSVLAAGSNRSIFFILAFAVTWILFTTGFAVLWTVATGPDMRLMEHIQIIK